MKFSVAELVKWYEYYACGTIVKDSGLGIVCNALAKMSKAQAYHVLGRNGLKTFSETELEKYDSMD